jgi:hypothetical protein
MRLIRAVVWPPLSGRHPGGKVGESTPPNHFESLAILPDRGGFIQIDRQMVATRDACGKFLRHRHALFNRGACEWHERDNVDHTDARMHAEVAVNRNETHGRVDQQVCRRHHMGRRAGKCENRAIVIAVTVDVE